MLFNFEKEESIIVNIACSYKYFEMHPQSQTSSTATAARTSLSVYCTRTAHRITWDPIAANTKRQPLTHSHIFSGYMALSFHACYREFAVARGPTTTKELDNVAAALPLYRAVLFVSKTILFFLPFSKMLYSKSGRAGVCAARKQSPFLAYGEYNISGRLEGSRRYCIAIYVQCRLLRFNAAP